MGNKLKIVYGNQRILPTGGLALVGALFTRSGIKGRLNQIKLREDEQPRVKSGDIAVSYLGGLCQGANDFEYIRLMQGDPEFYQAVLDIRDIPSPEIARQRMDQAEGRWLEAIRQSNAEMLRKTRVKPTPCSTGHIPLDVDVTRFDNSGTKKQGVSRTYKGYDGYAPIMAYLGEEGYLVNTELREGSTHCQKNTCAFLRESLRLSRQVCDRPLLVRMDAGNDSAENLALFHEKESKCDYIVKRNLRKESPDEWLYYAKNDPAGRTEHPREGKAVYYGSRMRMVEGVEQPVRQAYFIQEQTMLSNGQVCLVPDVEVQVFWTSLEVSEEEVVRLYHAHATCEQFHSEIKSDMEMERLPSGKFATNATVLMLGMMAYNALRILGQTSISGPLNEHEPRKPVLRKRLRTVIQNLIGMAVVFRRHARQCFLLLGKSNPWRDKFAYIYACVTACC